jgi:hypothetical protein
MQGSSSGTSLPTTTTTFVGTSGSSSTEANVAQIVGSTQSYGHFYCYGPKPTGSSSDVFTVRIGTLSGGSPSFSSSTATCTVSSGTISASSSITLTLSAGQSVDVQVVNGNTAGAVSWALGP